jgi:hypothetical protein
MISPVMTEGSRVSFEPTRWGNEVKAFALGDRFGLLSQNDCA